MFALFNAIDHACGFLPAGARLILYGLLIGVLAMAIYWYLSPRERILAIRVEMAEGQKALRAYKGTDPKEILRLSGKSIAPAFKQLVYLLGPTVAATVPVLLVMAWLELDYTYQLPAVGDPIKVAIHGDAEHSPHTTPADAEGRIIAVAPGNEFTINWPPADQIVKLLNATDDQTLLSLPLRRPVGDVAQQKRYSFLLEGSDRIELPQNAKISAIDFDLPTRQVWSVGPAWMRCWQTPFLLALSVAALVMKFTLKIV